MIREKKIFRQLTSKDVCQIYELLHERKLVSFPLTKENENKIDSLVANIVNSHYGEEFYLSIEQKAIAYLYFIIKDHAFIDGNKRTAVLTFKILCDLNNLELKHPELALDSLAVFIERIKNGIDHQEVILALTKLMF
jgi:prophage maintenance system killer protein